MNASGTSPVPGGPVPAGATSLRLSADAIQLTEEGEARLQVPLKDLPMGKLAVLNKQVTVGSRKLVVRSVSRIDAEQFRFDIDFGPAQGGVLLQSVSVVPYNGGGSGWFGMDPVTTQATEIMVGHTSAGEYLDVRLSGPTLRVQGPWLIELPVK